MVAGAGAAAAGAGGAGAAADHRRIIAVDPGVQTGLAWTDPFGYATLNVDGPEGLARLWELLQLVAPGELIVERYVGGTRASPAPFYVIGVLKLYAALHAVPLLLRSPAPRALVRRLRRTYPRHVASALGLLVAGGWLDAETL